MALDDFPTHVACGARSLLRRIWMTVAFAPTLGRRGAPSTARRHRRAPWSYRHATSRPPAGQAHSGLCRARPAGAQEPRPVRVLPGSAVRKWAPVRTYPGTLGQGGAIGGPLATQLNCSRGTNDNEEALSRSRVSPNRHHLDPEKARVYERWRGRSQSVSVSNSRACRGAGRARVTAAQNSRKAFSMSVRAGAQIRPTHLDRNAHESPSPEHRARRCLYSGSAARARLYGRCRAITRTTGTHRRCARGLHTESILSARATQRDYTIVVKGRRRRAQSS